MTTHPKIEELLQITGTPPDRRDLARRNYSRLLDKEGETALDARIAEFQNIHRDVAEWREKRVALQPQTAGAIAITEDSLVRKKVALRRLEAIIEALEELAQAQPSFAFAAGHRKASPSSRRATVLDALRKRAWNMLAPPPQSKELQVLSDCIFELKGLDGIIETGALPKLNLIDTGQAISGFGSLAAYVRMVAPDVVVTLNEGGAMIGEFIRAHLFLAGVPIIPLMSEHHSVSVPAGTRLPDRANRLLILDDVSRTGYTMRAAFDWVREHYSGSSVKAATMAASMEAIEMVGSADLHTPNPHVEVSVKIPYDSHAGFKVVGGDYEKSYVFGANALNAEDRLVVPIETIRKVEAEHS